MGLGPYLTQAGSAFESSPSCWLWARCYQTEVKCLCDTFLQLFRLGLLALPSSAPTLLIQLLPCVSFLQHPALRLECWVSPQLNQKGTSSPGLCMCCYRNLSLKASVCQRDKMMSHTCTHRVGGEGERAHTQEITLLRNVSKTILRWRCSSPSHEPQGKWWLRCRITFTCACHSLFSLCLFGHASAFSSSLALDGMLSISSSESNGQPREGTKVNGVFLKRENMDTWHLIPRGSLALPWQLKARKGRETGFGLFTASPLRGAILTVLREWKLNSSRARVRQRVLPPESCWPLFLVFF